MSTKTRTTQTHAVQIRAGAALIDGDLAIPERALGLVVFAHGSGSSRFSRRNRAVAQTLEDGGFATLLLDLLTRDEEAIDVRTREYRFDIDLLAHRVVAAIDWAAGESSIADLPIATFGASTGAAAALTSVIWACVSVICVCWVCCADSSSCTCRSSSATRASSAFSLAVSASAAPGATRATSSAKASGRRASLDGCLLIAPLSLVFC